MTSCRAAASFNIAPPCTGRRLEPLQERLPDPETDEARGVSPEWEVFIKPVYALSSLYYVMRPTVQQAPPTG